MPEEHDPQTGRFESTGGGGGAYAKGVADRQAGTFQNKFAPGSAEHGQYYKGHQDTQNAMARGQNPPGGGGSAGASHASRDQARGLTPGAGTGGTAGRDASKVDKVKHGK